MLKWRWIASTVGGVFLLTLVTGWAQANHVRIDNGAVGVVVPPPVPSAPTAVTPEVLQVEDIKAQQVRAHAIHANRIEADQIQGMVHHTDGVKIANGRGEIRAPDVAASTIYADTIKANLVLADVVYVRDLRLKK